MFVRTSKAKNATQKFDQKNTLGNIVTDVRFKPIHPFTQEIFISMCQPWQYVIDVQ